MEAHAHHVVAWVFSNLVALAVGGYLESRLGWIEYLVGKAKEYAGYAISKV